MNAEKLSKRLQQVADYIIQYGKTPIRLVDIGSDHAYLPVNLLLNGKIEWAIAGEVVDGPFESAQKEVKLQQLDHKIDVRKGDGFEVVAEEDQINTAAICGMGGVLITSILQEGFDADKLPSLLVLQANNGVPNLRKWLMNHNYQLLNETLIDEKGQIYDVLVAEKTNQAEAVEDYSRHQLFFGPYNLENPPAAFEKYWQRDLEHQERILSQLTAGKTDHKETEFAPDRLEKIQAVKEEIQMIKEVLAVEKN